VSLGEKEAVEVWASLACHINSFLSESLLKRFVSSFTAHLGGKKKKKKKKKGKHDWGEKRRRGRRRQSGVALQYKSALLGFPCFSDIHVMSFCEPGKKGGKKEKGKRSSLDVRERRRVGIISNILPNLLAPDLPSSSRTHGTGKKKRGEGGERKTTGQWR